LIAEGTEIHSLTFEIGGSRYVANSILDSGNTTFMRDEFYVNSTGSYSIRLLATIRNDATDNSNITFVAPHNIIASSTLDGNITYIDTDTIASSSEITGSIQIATIKVVTPKVSLNNNLSNTVSATVNENVTRTIFEGPISSQANIIINSFDLTVT
jgi:hypothetical protein